MTISFKSALAGAALVAFAQAASATCTSGCTPTQPAGTTINLNNGVTANPVSNANATATSNPVANGGSAIVTANPVANGGTSNAVSNANLTGGNNTATLTGGNNAATSNATLTGGNNTATLVGGNNAASVGNVSGGNSTASVGNVSGGTALANGGSSKAEIGDQTTTVGVGVGVGVESTNDNTNIVRATTGDNTNVNRAEAGDSNAAATVQSGAIQLNQTYKQVKQVASAIAAPAMPANVAPGNCWQVTQGASLALQSANWGVSGNMSGKAEWTEQSDICEKFQQIRTGMASPNPAMNAAAVLIKGDDVLIQDLMGQKGQDLKNFFGTTAQATTATYTTTVAAPAPAPTEAPVYICPKGTPKAGQAGEVVRMKTGELALNCGM